MIMYVMYLMLFITTSNLEEANRIAHELLKEDSVPEIMAIPIKAGYSQYLSWIDEVIGK